MNELSEKILIWGIVTLVGLCVIYFLAAFLYKKYSKTYHKKEEQRQKAREDERKVYELLNTWSDMLFVKSQIKIFRSPSETEIEKAYSDFIISHKNAGSEVIGHQKKGMLYSRQEPEITYEDGVYVMVIKFKRYELKDGISEDEYSSAVEKYESFKKSIDYHIV